MGVKKYLVSFGQTQTSRSEGYLLHSSDLSWVWLKDRQKKTVRKGKVGPNFCKQLICGTTIRVADFSIKILKEWSECDYPQHREDNRDIANASSTSRTDKNETTCLAPEPIVHGIALLDPVLMRVMRPYQIEAANFILKRLQDCRGENSGADIPLTGAILADDMGTGKTLVGLSVLWALCRHGRGKGIIVCPSSLISNWRKEVRKWLPATLGRTALYVLGGKGSASLNVSTIYSRFGSISYLLLSFHWRGIRSLVRWLLSSQARHPLCIPCWSSAMKCSGNHINRTSDAICQSLINGVFADYLLTNSTPSLLSPRCSATKATGDDCTCSRHICY
jgi:hypothetical protein